MNFIRAPPGIEKEKTAANMGVMVVENNEVMRQGLSMLLAGYMGIEIVGESANDEEAVRLFREFDPYVILMDISMTKMNGIEGHPDHPC